MQQDLIFANAPLAAPKPCLKKQHTFKDIINVTIKSKRVIKCITFAVEETKSEGPKRKLKSPPPPPQRDRTQPSKSKC